MLFPVPFPPPVTEPEADAVHAKVVPATPDESAMEVDAPLQICCDDGVATATGFGSTVIMTVIGSPAHEAAVGVIV